VGMLARNQVFINPHLTWAEAMAAYEQRCQRRIRNKRPVPVTAGEDTGKTNDSSVSLAVKTVATDTSLVRFNNCMTAVVNVDNVLAATAAVFVPASVHSGRPVISADIKCTTKAVKSDLTSDSMTFYVINPTSLVKPSALQQLCTELTQFNIATAIVAES